MDADKFHANCYSFSGTVSVAHYLLRQKPWRVLWGGGYVVLDNVIADFTRTEDLLGLSTYLDYEDIAENNDDLEEKDWFDKAKFIGDNHNRWNRIDVWKEALEYFDWKKTHCVKYNGYLLNHTQKLAVSLSDYFIRSMFWTKKRVLAAIDAIPPLAETGGGTRMAFFEGMAADSTEELAATWCGDLLQIVDELPGGYEPVNCCFVEMWDRAELCYDLFGVDESNYLLGDREGKRYECAKFGYDGERGRARHVKIELAEGKIRYIAELIP
jgi:hypothetical protein